MPICLLFLLALQQPESTFRDLFAGQSLDGWVVEGPVKLKSGEAIWTVTPEGYLRATAGKDEFGGGGFGFLRYDRQKFADFTLRVEYRFVPAGMGIESGNSGIGIRTVPFDRKQSRNTRPSFAAYEIQLLDDAGKPANKNCTGSIYRYVAPRSNPVKAAPEWNSIEVECTGPHIRIRVNDILVVDADQGKIDDLPARNKPQGIPAPKEKPLSGYICLQSHSGTVEFRKVQIREHSPK